MRVANLALYQSNTNNVKHDHYIDPHYCEYNWHNVYGSISIIHEIKTIILSLQYFSLNHTCGEFGHPRHKNDFDIVDVFLC